MTKTVSTHEIIKRIIALILVLLICFSSFFLSNAFAVGDGTEGSDGTGSGTSTMTDKQLSSIAMLNYLTVLSQEINASTNSRLYLDNVYSDIVNNINPNAVDEDTMTQIRVLLNTINAYQSIETKRERIQYIYEQNQANAFQRKIPNPMSVLSLVQSKSPIKALVSVIYMAVDSSDSYKSYLSEIESKYIEEGWTLEDSAAQNLHESRSEAFEYMVEMCQKYNLDGMLALNERSVESFVLWENNPNITRRIEFLEKNRNTYQAYGKYWLVLAESYYAKGEYAKCLEAVKTYEDLHINTFRKDHDFAKTLSIALAASSELFTSEEYVSRAEHYLQLLLKNIETDDWALRYLAAQSYLDLYARTNDRNYLQKAYDLAEENINYLIDVQYQKNDEYLSEVQKLVAKRNDSKQRKEEIKTFNKWLEEERKVALPPVYQPLVLNCDLLFGLAEELNISQNNQVKIEEMLHDTNRPLFLIEQLEQRYYFNRQNERDYPDILFDGTVLEIPAVMIEQGATIRVTVTDGDSVITFTDWVLEKVDRGKQSDPQQFTAVFKSKDIKSQKYTDNSIVVVEIVPPEESNYEIVTYTFEVQRGKKLLVFNDTKFVLVK